MSLKPTIGLEIHVELKTNSKMFCSCQNNSDELRPNSNVCPVCTAQPGALPVINQEAIKKVIKTALALNCQIEKKTFFERKNYFYPDLPKGYQISQYVAPLSRKGHLKLSEAKQVGIERIHLEEDTGKLLHPEGEKYSLVDFNRAGVPLMELVTDPVIESAEQARKFAKQLQMILRSLDISDANMEKGQMRIEVNISLAPVGAKKLGTKVEIKNLNSIRSMEKAIDFEIKRQTKLLEKKEKVIQETRGWHDVKQITFSQRTKEEAHDYRYFPEPDLPPIKLTDQFIDQIRQEIGELPANKKERFKKEYLLTEKEAQLYIKDEKLADYLEKVISELEIWLKQKMPELEEGNEQKQKMIKLASNYISTDLQYLLKEARVPTIKITPENFAEFLTMIFSGEISSKIAKIILKEMFETGGDPSQIIESRGLAQITDQSEIETIAADAIKNNQEAAAQYKKGKENALQFLIGQIMVQSKGKANPKQAAEILKKLLK